MNGLLIGKLIYQVLENSEELEGYVGSKIYPIVAPQDTTYPFIIYTKSNVYASLNTKDGWLLDNISFTVTVVSDKYLDTIYISNIVRNLFENHEIHNNELVISNIHMTQVTEVFNDDTYIQNLYFNCEGEDYTTE